MIGNKIGQINFYRRHSFLINCFILTGLFLGNCFLSYFTFIAYSFVLFLVIISEINIAISYLFFTFAFNSICLPYSAISFGVCVFAMMVKLCIIKYKEDKSNFKFSKTTTILFVAFIVYLLLPIKREFDWAYLLRGAYLLLGSLLIYIFARFCTEFNWRKNLKIALISFIISCGFAFFHDISPVLQLTHMDWWWGDNMSGFGALMFNPNTLAMFCMAAVTISVYYTTKFNANLLDVLTILGYVLIGFFTKSRAFIVIALFNLIVLFIVGIKKKNKNILFMFLGLFLSLILVVFLRNDYIKSIINDFKVKDKNTGNVGDFLYDFTSSRTEIWSVYFKDWVSSAIYIIFGRGISSPVLIQIKMSATQVRNISPHNMYFTMLYQLGIIGAVLFITLIIFVIKDALKTQPKVGKAALIPLISFMVLALVEDLMFYMF